MIRSVVGVKRSTWHTPRNTPARSAAPTTAAHAASVPASGFSHRMS